MCFIIPKKIVTHNGTRATIEDGSDVDVSQIKKCTVGDYVIVTNGIAVLKVSKAEAQSTRSLVKETYEKLS